MGLSRQELDLVIKRCDSRHDRGKRVLWYETWCRFAWPALALVLTGLLVAVMFGLRSFWEGLAAVGVIVITAVFALGLAKDRTPAWQWLAYVDRQSGARGSLLQYAESGDYSPNVPPRALDLSLPQAFPLRSLWVWVLLIAGFVVWAMLPIAAVIVPAATSTPIPVQRLERLVDEMELVAPDSQTVEDVKRQLKELKERQGEGLERDDFDALKRMEEQLKASTNTNDNPSQQLSKAQAQQAEQLANDLQELSQQLAAKPPSASEMKQAENLNQQAQALLDELQRRGQQSRENGQDQQGQQGEQQGQQGTDSQAGQQGKEGDGKEGKGEGEGEQGSGQGKQNSFNQNDVGQMQQRMQQYQQALQQATQQAMQQAGESGADVSRGPGSADLKYNNTGRTQNEKFKDELFGLNAGEDALTLGSGLSKRAEQGTSDAATSDRQFTEGADTQYWDKKVLPRHRETLEEYFSDDAE